MAAAPPPDLLAAAEAAAAESPVPLTEHVLHNFGRGRVLKDNTLAINALDFSEDGRLLVTSSDDESIRLYDALEGKPKKVVHSKRYGVSQVRFTHHPNVVLCASKNKSRDETLRLLSLYDNRYLRYFKGHRAPVTTLEISPAGDQFLSASKDATVRLWDLRTSACQAVVRVPPPHPIATFDPQGLVFAVAGRRNIVKLYDARKLETAFVTFTVNHDANQDSVHWASVDFSPDGRYLLLSTNTNRLHLLDAFSGDQIHTFQSYENKGHRLQACFSPDSQFVSVGSSDGSIHTWSVRTHAEVSVWRGHIAASRIVKWNPKRIQFASACLRVALWVPLPQEAIDSKPRSTPIAPPPSRRHDGPPNYGAPSTQAPAATSQFFPYEAHGQSQGRYPPRDISTLPSSGSGYRR